MYPARDRLRIGEHLMRILLATAAAVLTLSAGALPAAAFSSTTPAGVQAAASDMGLRHSVARVCRDICNDWGQCRRRCWDEPTTYRSYDDDDIPPRVYYDRRRYDEPAPGVGIYGPGIGIELGRPRW